MEDGVLWRLTAEGVVAAEIAAGTPAAAVGLRRGDVLLAIDDRPVQQVSDVVAALHAASEGGTVRYTVLRLGSREVVDVRIAPVPTGSGSLYFLLAGVGIFTLLVGGAVRLRRPRDPATLHFFWLAVAFFGVFTFSFSGRLDRLDWVFYWGDVVVDPAAAAAVPALHAGVPRAAAALDGGRDRAHAVPAHLRPGGAAGRRARSSRSRGAAATPRCSSASSRRSIASSSRTWRSASSAASRR